MIFNRFIGGSAASASIFVYGEELQSTCTVYAEKGATRINGVWNSTRNGFEIAPVREYGTWALTAINGTKAKTIDVLVDAAQEFSVEVRYHLYLYNNGDECTDVTGGWSIVQLHGGDKDIIVTKKADRIELYAPLWSNGQIVTNRNIDISGYSELVVSYGVSNIAQLHTQCRLRAENVCENTNIIDHQQTINLPSPAHIALTDSGVATLTISNTGTNVVVYIYAVWLE